jgi:hypothetical protein
MSEQSFNQEVIKVLGDAMAHIKKQEATKAILLRHINVLAESLSEISRIDGEFIRKHSHASPDDYTQFFIDRTGVMDRASEVVKEIMKEVRE